MKFTAIPAASFFILSIFNIKRRIREKEGANPVNFDDDFIDARCSQVYSLYHQRRLYIPEPPTVRPNSFWMRSFISHCFIGKGNAARIFLDLPAYSESDDNPIGERPCFAGPAPAILSRDRRNYCYAL